LKKKGLIILNVIDNIKWKLGVLQFHSAYTRAAPARDDEILSRIQPQFQIREAAMQRTCVY
jgi:hypothetical protein